MLPLEKVKEILSQAGSREVYLVGGLVRDYLLGKTTFEDIDLAVGEGKEGIEGVSENICKALGGKCKRLILGRDNAYTVTIFASGVKVDITPFEDIEEDLARRDFTINAVAWNVNDFLRGHDRFVDPFGGVSDLKKGVLRPVSIKNLEEDPVRLLRQYRFVSKLGLKRTEEVKEFTRQKGYLINIAVGERVLKELLKIFALPQSHKAILEMVEDGFDREVFKTSIPDEALKLLERYEVFWVEKKPQNDTPLQEGFGKRVFLKLAVVLSKLPPLEVAQFLTAYPFGNEVKKFIASVLEALSILEKAKFENLRESYFFLKKYGELLNDLEVLSRLTGWEDKVLRLKEIYKRSSKLKPILQGNELVKHLGLSPSPLIGKLLDEIAIAQLLGYLNSKEEALSYAKKLLLNINSNDNEPAIG